MKLFAIWVNCDRPRGACMGAAMFLAVMLSICLSPAPLAWGQSLLVPAGESRTLPQGTLVYRAVDIGAGATVFLSGDTEIHVLGSDDLTGAAFVMHEGASISPSRECVYGSVTSAALEDGADGAEGEAGDSGWWDWSTFIDIPYGEPGYVYPGEDNKPTYHAPTHVDGFSGTHAGSAAQPVFSGGKFPDLIIRVNGDAFLGTGSSIIVDEAEIYYDEATKPYRDHNRASGGDGGDGGPAGSYEVFRYSGIYYGTYTYDGGNGGNGGNGTDGLPGIDGLPGGALRMVVLGDLTLNGGVVISANGGEACPGGTGGRCGLPGAFGEGVINTDGEYGYFGANGLSADGGDGGDSGQVDLRVQGNLIAPYHEPGEDENGYNWISAQPGSGREGGDSSGTPADMANVFHDRRRNAPNPTAPGTTGKGGLSGSLKIYVGGYLGTSPQQVAGGAPDLGGCNLLLSVSGRSGRYGGSADNNYSETATPAYAQTGALGGLGGSIQITSGKGIYAQALLAASTGGKGGGGGDGCDPAHCGVGRNGGNGGNVQIYTPALDGLYAIYCTGGEGGQGGYSPLGSAADGAAGTSGTLEVIITSEEPDSPKPKFFPMTLKMEPVPSDQEEAPVGSTITYRCTFTNSSDYAISNFHMISDAPSVYCQAVQTSGVPIGSWNATANHFQTTPRTLGSGEVVTWIFAVTVRAPFYADTQIVNGVTAKGFIDGETISDHAVVSLSMVANGIFPVVTGESGVTEDATPSWSWASGGGNATFRYQLDGQEEDEWIITSATEYTPGLDLPDGLHTLYVQEQCGTDIWSVSGCFTVTINANNAVGNWWMY